VSLFAVPIVFVTKSAAHIRRTTRRSMAGSSGVGSAGQEPLSRFAGDGVGFWGFVHFWGRPMAAACGLTRMALNHYLRRCPMAQAERKTDNTLTDAPDASKRLRAASFCAKFRSVDFSC